jgi:hypothetical protein
VEEGLSKELKRVRPREREERVEDDGWGGCRGERVEGGRGVEEGGGWGGWRKAEGGRGWRRMEEGGGWWWTVVDSSGRGGRRGGWGNAEGGRGWRRVEEGGGWRWKVGWRVRRAEERKRTYLLRNINGVGKPKP